MDGDSNDSASGTPEVGGRPNRKGPSRRSILSTLKGLGVGIGAAVVVGRDAIVAFAQQVTGVLGSPSATTTIPGNQLPRPPPEFGGVIMESAKNSKPWWV
jgi:hypothetical protein